MSSFIVHDQMISEVLNYIRLTYDSKNYSESVLSAVPYNLKEKILNETGHALFEPVSNKDFEFLTIIGKIILDYNCKSYLNTYKDHKLSSFYDKWPFKFKSHYERISTIQYLKYIDCIEYQSDNLSQEDLPEFNKLISYLRKYGIKKIDGYNQAKWSL